jgi:predicted TIM-barrel fold metal-dependent hydrolase
MRIIDFHAHIFPAKIAAKATQAIGTFYKAPMRYSGSIAELLESGSKIGVEKYIVHSTATKPEQVESINDFIIGEVSRESRFIGFGTLHPDFAGADAEISRIRDAGLRGIKLHPDFQRFAIDDEKMDSIYDRLSDEGIPVLVHAGDCRYDFSGPRRIARVLDRHPRLKFVAAHFGGYTEWDESLEILAGRELMFDTSSTLWKLPREAALEIIRRHGVSRFLFGSDFPMWDHEGELARFMALGLSEDENRAILAENAIDFLGL